MDVLMPQLGETVAEGTVANWHKKEGDTVAVDEILFDVETDKVSMEVPSLAACTAQRRRSSTAASRRTNPAAEPRRP